MEEIRQLIVDLKFEKVFQKLSEKKTSHDVDFANQVDVLNMRYNACKRERLFGRATYENLTIEVNQIGGSLLELCTAANFAFKNKDEAAKTAFKKDLVEVIEAAELKILAINKKFSPKANHGEQQYLVDWLLRNYKSISAGTAKLTFEIFGKTGEDTFYFERGLNFALRFLFKSYLYNANEWLSEPGFIFNFKKFEKIEFRIALLIFKNKILAAEGIIREDKIALIERLDLLDKGVKEFE